MGDLFLPLLGALLMRLGLAVTNFGAVRSKNSSATFARQLLDLSVATLAVWAASFVLMRDSGRDIHTMVWFLAIASLAGVMHTGATSERSRLWPVLGLSLVTAGITMPIAIVLIRKWLHGWGYIDAGLGYVHLLGATTAAVAVKFIGPRDGKYHRDGSTSIIPGHNLPLEMIGAFVVVIGGLMLLRTPIVLIAAAASAVTCAVYCQRVYAKIDLPLLAASLVAGVVAISPGASTLPEWAAFFVGIAAGLITPIAIVKIDMVLKFDDVTGAIAVHGGAAVVGLLAAMRIDAGWGERFRTLGVQVLAIAIFVTLAAIVATATLMVIRGLSPLRTKEADEYDGLDIADHDTASYPDFQQNSIR
jgi:Amt family ammonium transporter